MNDPSFNQILKLNKEFYQSTEKSFDRSRAYPWKGWSRVLEIINQQIPQDGPPSVLDIACGNGRFGKFLLENWRHEFQYLGLDTNNFFLSQARKINERFDLKNLDCVTQINEVKKKYDLIVSFGFTHHLPDTESRNNWFINIGELLNKNGIACLTFWNFSESENVSKDFILGWEGKDIPRYCHIYSEKEINQIIRNFKNNDISLIEKFYSDGKTNKTNTYLIFNKN